MSMIVTSTPLERLSFACSISGTCAPVSGGLQWAALGLVLRELTRCCQRASHVSRSVSPAPAGAKPTTDGSGPGSHAVLARFDRTSSCWRMSPVCSQLTLAGFSQEFSWTWPRSGTWDSGTVCRLPTLAHRTAGTGSGSLPTPTASDAQGSQSNNNSCLRTFATSGYSSKRLFPTPDANCWKGGSENQRKRQLNGQLAPGFVEFLMGYPRHWTAIDRTPGEPADWSRGEWPDQPRTERGVPNRVNRLKCLGNAIVPQMIPFLLGEYGRARD
jgi:hypothetical protein